MLRQRGLRERVVRQIGPPNLRAHVVLDVGADRGQFGKRLRRDGYTGRIVSFEPVPHIADQLEKGAAATGAGRCSASRSATVMRWRR